MKEAIRREVIKRGIRVGIGRAVRSVGRYWRWFRPAPDNRKRIEMLCAVSGNPLARHTPPTMSDDAQTHFGSPERRKVVEGRIVCKRRDSWDRLD